MGGCCSRAEPKIAYQYSFPLRIEKTFGIDRHQEGAELRIELSPPRDTFGAVETIEEGVSVKVSGCVIAGYNARLTREVECKDRLFVTTHDSTVFAFVLDGHGEFGGEAASEASKFFQGYYVEHQSEFKESTEDCMKTAFRLCQEHLRERLERHRRTEGDVGEGWRFSGA